MIAFVAKALAGPHATLIKVSVVAVVLGVTFASGTGVGAYGMHAWTQPKYDLLKAEYDAFKAVQQALSNAAKTLRDATIKADKARKDRADETQQRTSDALTIALNSLRSTTDRASSAGLPAAPAGSSRADLACFDRAEYLREDGELTKRLVEGARSLADEGTAGTLGLDTAKRWHQDK